MTTRFLAILTKLSSKIDDPLTIRHTPQAYAFAIYQLNLFFPHGNLQQQESNQASFRSHFRLDRLPCLGRIEHRDVPYQSLPH